MNPPRFLLDTLDDSITSGAFIDTKFYVFSRREASRCVGSPRALYCNSRVLSTVPYFSSCGYRESPRAYTPNCIAPKCSRMHSRKDNRGTSTRDSPLVFPPLRFMTTCLTAIWKMNARAPKRRTQNLPKAMIPSCHRVLKHRLWGRLHVQPHPWSSHYRMQVRFKMTTGWPRYPLDRTNFSVNFVSGLMTIHQEWEKLPSSATQQQ